MPVESRNLNLYPPQILFNREMMLNTVAPMTGTTSPAAETMLLPPMRGDGSNLTYAHHLPGVSRKRSREDSVNTMNMNQLVTYPNDPRVTNICGGDNRSSAGQFMFLGQDFSTQIQGQQLEVDNFFAHHTEQLKLEITERRTSYSRRIMAAVEDGITNKLKTKEDELQQIVKFNEALEERMKSLSMETQIWRDLAQTNEATANILRANLDQVLTQVQNFQGTAEQLDEAQSCCESNDDQEPERRYDDAGNRHGQGGIRLCRECGKEEACVLLMPCRHLCLCSVCGSFQNICPVCKCPQNCSLHVNFDSS